MVGISQILGLIVLAKTQKHLTAVLPKTESVKHTLGEPYINKIGWNEIYEIFFDTFDYVF